MGDDLAKKLEEESKWFGYPASVRKLLHEAAVEIEHLRNELRGIPQGGFNPEEET